MVDGSMASVPRSSSPIPTSLKTELDLYDMVEYLAQDSPSWLTCTIVGISRVGDSYDLQLLCDGSVVQGVNASAIRPMYGAEERLRLRQLATSSVCLIDDEDHFQLETSLFTSKVLRKLQSEHVLDNSSSKRPSEPYRRSLTSIASSADTEPALLDRLMADPTFPTQTHIMKIVDAIKSNHERCTHGDSAKSRGSGTTCIHKEWSSTFASPDSVNALCDKMIDLLDSTNVGTLCYATVPPSGKLVVVGDTHGQLEDVFWMWFRHGFPGLDNIFIFNGDVADRGSHSLEIFILLFLFKWMHPDTVHLNRGNHEDDHMNLTFGFCAELRHKFGAVEGGRIHLKFLQVFYHLPLACVIDNWNGRYKCKETGVLIDIKITPNIRSKQPVRTRLVTLQDHDTKTFIGAKLALNLRDKRRKIDPKGSSVSSKVGRYKLIFEGREAYRCLSEDGVCMLQWSNGVLWELTSKRVLVLHGGIPVPYSRFNSLDGEGSVSLSDFINIASHHKLPASANTVHEKWMQQILWSDPREPGGTRGRGTPFYLSDTESFILRNNLAMVIRSHEVPANRRGYQFHHNKKLLTLFSASNYCGYCQNFGAVIIFATGSLSRIVEHWAPALTELKEIFRKHSAAKQEVRNYIAAEIEKALTPKRDAKSRKPSLATLVSERRVVEYVRGLIVKHKSYLRETFSAFSKGSLEISFDVWVKSMGSVIGRQFPWSTLWKMLDQPGLILPSDSGTTTPIPDQHDANGLASVNSKDNVESTINFTDFLSVFLPIMKHFSDQFIAWKDAVVSGFMSQFSERILEIQGTMLTRQTENTVDFHQFETMFTKIVGSSRTQARLLWYSLMESTTEENRKKELLSCLDICKAFSAYFMRLSLLPDNKPSGPVKASLYKLSKAIATHYGSLDSFFFQHLKCDDSGYLPTGVFIKRLEGSAMRLKLHPVNFPFKDIGIFLSTAGPQSVDEKAPANAAGSTKRPRIVETHNKLENKNVTYMSFVAGLHLTSSNTHALNLAGTVAEHATSSIYFHRVALRCAFNALDAQKTGYIDRRSFAKALHALNNAVEAEWKLTIKQIDTVIDAIGYEKEELDNVDDANPVGSKRPRAYSYSVVKASEAGPDEDLKLWVRYENFISAFDIVDKRKMIRRASSRLLKEGYN